MGAASLPPKYFHLLSDEDLTGLRGVVEALLRSRSEIVRRWYALYLRNFGDTRSLSEREFKLIYEPALEYNKSALLIGDIERYATGVARLGAILAEHGVSLEETITSSRLFHESARALFDHDAEIPSHAWTAFDRLGHARIILLTRAYFSSDSAVSMERAAALEHDAARLSPDHRTGFRGLIGASSPMRQLYVRIEAAGSEPGTLLIFGEDGTGKEAVARAIHGNRSENNEPFVAFNCAAIPADLIDRELFGYERASSHSDSEFLGAFRAADGGTLFLKEITEMGLETQSKLLRAIQERAVRPVDSQRVVPVDVRLIASTARVPEEAVAEGKFRSDLYFRLRASVVKVPPVRERPGDVSILAQHFISTFNGRLGRGVVGVDEPAMRALMAHSWPGNVREFASVIEGAVVLTKKPMIGLSDLPESLNRHMAARNGVQPSDGPASGTVVSFAEMERDAIRRALETTGRNKLRAASLLRISRKKLYAKIKQHNL